MEFREFFQKFLIEAPVVTTKLKGKESKHIDPVTGKSWRTKVHQKLKQLKKIKEEHPQDSLYVIFSNGVNEGGGASENPKRIFPTPKGDVISSLKLGINPSAQDGGTPLGVYAYPIDYVINRSIDGVPFASRRKFLIVVKSKNKNMLYTSNKDGEITDFEEMKELLSGKRLESNIKKHIQKEIEKLKKTIRTKTIQVTTPNGHQLTPEEFEEYEAEKSPAYKFLYLKDIDTKRKNQKVESEEIPETVLDYIGNKVYSLIEKKIKALNTVDRKLDFNFDGLLRYLSFFNDAEGLSHNFGINGNAFDTKYSIEEFIREYIDNDFQEENLSPDRLKATINKDGEMKEVNLLDYFSKFDSFLYPNDRFKSNLSFFVIKKYKDHGFFKILKKRISKIENQLEKIKKEVQEKRKEAISIFNFPFKDEFLKIADEYGADITQALENLLSNWDQDSSFASNRSNNVSNFVYRMSKELAHQSTRYNFSKSEYAKRSGSRPYVVWTSILKRLGFKGVLDEEGSGTIYAHEETQVAFFDVAQLQILDIIKNDNVSPKSHKKKSPLSWEETDSAYERWFKGLLKTINISLKDAHYLYREILRYSIPNQQILEKYEQLSKILVVLHSYFRFAEELHKENSANVVSLKNRIKLQIEPQKFISFFSLITKEINDDPNLMNHMNYILSIMTKINDYLNSEQLIANLPKPSALRARMQKLKE